MDIVLTILNWTRYITPAIVIIGFIVTIILCVKGILPVLYRLGMGLAKRKIAIFAKGDNLSSLKNLLVDSKLFKESNICEIPLLGDIGSAQKNHASLYLVQWQDWESDIDKILHIKSDECPLIVYAPSVRIPQENLDELNNTRNCALSNFRGRLLNDIVTAMITTSFQK